MLFYNVYGPVLVSTVMNLVFNMQWVELTIKTIQKSNAEDNTDAILAEAEFIFNNADLFIVDEEFATAA